jgi:hypothetical protein
MKSVVELEDEIESLFDKKPDGRNKTQLREWANTINNLIKEVNELAKIKIYNEVK